MQNMIVFLQMTTRRVTFYSFLLLAGVLLIAIPSPVRAQSNTASVESEGEESGEEIIARHEYFLMRRAGGPGKSIPDGAYEKVFDDLRRGTLTKGNRSAFAFPSWASVNPSGMFYGRTGANYISGRTNAFAFHPSDPNTFCVGAASGGVWKTSDGGSNFQILTNQLSALTSGAIAIDPNNANIVFVATGELNYSGDSYYGDGIFKSTDAGNSWTKVASTSIGSYFSSIIVNPSNSNIVYAGGSAGAYKSIDAGLTWSSTSSGSYVNAMIMDPTNTQVLYVASGYPTGSSTIRKTTNGGSTWNTLAGGLPTSNVGRTALAMAPGSSTTIYASIARNVSPYSLLGLYRTTDGGATWTLRNSTTNYLGQQGWYDNAIAVSPANPNLVVVGGLDIYSSSDGGATLTQKTDWATTSTSIFSHADIHYLGYNGAMLYCGSDGGAYKSTDDGTDWTDMNQTISSLQFMSADYDPSNVQNIYGGTQDNNKGSTANGGTSWIQRTTGDGGYTVVDPVSTTYIYGQYVNGSVQRSANSGVSYTEIRPTGSTGGLFYNPYEMAPTDHLTIVFGRDDVWKTTSAQTATQSSGWTKIATSTTTGGGVSAIGISSQSTNVIYIGTSQGHVLITTDNGANWNVSIASGFPFVSDFAVDPANDSVCYATFTGFNSTQHVSRTTNRGASWSDAGGDLPNVPVNTVVLRSSPPRMIMIGTDLGVFRSTNEGAHWILMNEGMPSVPVLDLKYRASTNLLLAASHGRGCFTYDMSVFFPSRHLTVNSTTPSSGASITIAPNDSAGLGSGTTPLLRTYFDGMNISLTASAMAGGNYFSKWTKDGSDLSPNLSVSVLMNAEHTMNAVYNALPTVVLNCLSTNPSSVTIPASPVDNFGLGAGTTSFVRYYLQSTVISLLAPATAGGNYFLKWQRDGADFSTSANVNVTMDSSHTMRAIYSPLAIFSVSPPSLVFGSLKGGHTTGIDSVTVSNTGNATLTITSVASSPAPYTVQPASGSVSPGSSKKFYVTFAPPRLNAEYPGTLIFAHNAPGSPDSVSMSGRGYHIFDPSDTSIDFGDLHVDSTKLDSMSVRVDTTLPMNVSSVVSTNGAFAVTPDSAHVLPGSPVHFAVSFHPLSTGIKSGFLIFSHDQPGSPDTIAVLGRGVAPGFSAHPASVAFGKVLPGHTAHDTLTITNTGTGTLVVDSITGSGGPFAISPLTATIPPSDSAKFPVSFAPETLGVRTRQLIVWHNASSSPDSIPLSGEGTMYLSTTVAVKALWNLVSIPLQAVSMAKADLFVHATSRAYAYSGGAYASRDTLEPGAGYWVKYAAPELIDVVGASVQPETVAVDPGWNLIGIPGQAYFSRSVDVNPTGMSVSAFFGYAGNYVAADTLFPGKGYWVHVSGSGTLIFPLPGGQNLRMSTRIAAGWAGLPPPPPDEPGAGRTPGELPATFALEQNYPNPFNPSTVIRYQIPVASHVTLRIFNVLGEQVATLLDDTEEPGYKSVSWESGKNTNGKPVSMPSGVYYYRLTAGAFSDIRKMLFIK